MCYLRTIHKIIEESQRLPWKDYLIQIDSRKLSVIVLIVFLCMVILKGYCIQIIWRCYKYLNLRQNAMIIQEQLANNEISLLPDYDEAVNVIIKSFHIYNTEYYLTMHCFFSDEGNTSPLI